MESAGGTRHLDIAMPAVHARALEVPRPTRKRPRIIRCAGFLLRHAGRPWGNSSARVRLAGLVGTGIRGSLIWTWCAGSSPGAASASARCGVGAGARLTPKSAREWARLRPSWAGSTTSGRATRWSVWSNGPQRSLHALAPALQPRLLRLTSMSGMCPRCLGDGSPIAALAIAATGPVRTRGSGAHSDATGPCRHQWR